MNTFTLEITLGNSAMLDPIDVASALRDYSDQLMNAYDFQEAPQAIFDINGNRVGTAHVEAV